MKKLVVLSIAMLISLTVIAQEKFEEGKIKMVQIISTDNAQMQAMFNQMMGEEPMETIAYLKGNKSRTELSNKMSGGIITISDMDKKQMLLLMDNPMLGKKYSLTTLGAEEEEKLKDNITIVEGTETKMILGYECLKSTVTINQDGVVMTMDMYITEKIIPIMSQQTSLLGDKLKGFPMYMVINMNQQGVDMVITTEVIELIPEAVSDAKFNMTPPEGYTKMEGM